jgi:hypothetical protein
MITISREDRVAVVTVDRAEALNALDAAVLTELRDRLRELAEDEDVRAVVLTGAGERAFVAGADIKEMSVMGVDEARAWGDLGHEVARLLETMPSRRSRRSTASRSAAAASSRSPVTSATRRALRSSASPRSRSGSSQAGEERSASRAPPVSVSRRSSSTRGGWSTRRRRANAGS